MKSKQWDNRVTGCYMYYTEINSNLDFIEIYIPDIEYQLNIHTEILMLDLFLFHRCQRIIYD